MFRLHVTTLLACTCLRTAVASGRETSIRWRADIARPRCLRVSFKTRLGFPNYYENNLVLLVFVISRTVWLQKMKINNHCVELLLYLGYLFHYLTAAAAAAAASAPPGSRATRTAPAAATATQGLPNDAGTPRDGTSPRATLPRRPPPPPPSVSAP